MSQVFFPFSLDPRAHLRWHSVPRIVVPRRARTVCSDSRSSSLDKLTLWNPSALSLEQL
jgi:hypothetical protein